MTSKLNQHTPVIEPKKSSKTIKPPQRYSSSLNYILLTNKGEPKSCEEAVQVDESIKWELVMKDEMDSLVSNQTWQLARLPKRKKALQNKWVYQINDK